VTSAAVFRMFYGGGGDVGYMEEILVAPVNPRYGDQVRMRAGALGAAVMEGVRSAAGEPQSRSAV